MAAPASTMRAAGCRRGAPSFDAFIVAMAFLFIGRSSPCSSARLLLPRPLALVPNGQKSASRRVVRTHRCWSATSAIPPATTGVPETSRPSNHGWEDPWSHPRVTESTVSRTWRKSNKARFRQHVNPLARQYQQPCALPEYWPRCAYKDVTLPLHVDIGCGKGGFLMDLVMAASTSFPDHAETGHPAHADPDATSSFFRDRHRPRNLLGLEIRPLVAQHARGKAAQLRRAATQARPATNDNTSDDDWTRRVDFIGCNVNVDLDRILSAYKWGGARTEGGTDTALLEVVTIQFPDPHFKSHHAKRRVVNSDLVRVLAKHVRLGSGRVFLQSDVQYVLDDMRQQFAAHPLYFADLSQPHEYYPHNVFGVPTERELSVLEKGLPVYRALFARTAVPFEDDKIDEEGAAESSSSTDPHNQ